MRRFDIAERLDLNKGNSVVFDSVTDCDVPFVDEIDYARWKRTGEPEPHPHTRMQINCEASYAGIWYLLVRYRETSSMILQDDLSRNRRIEVMRRP